MYRWTRTVQIQGGKLTEGLGWALDMTKYVNEKMPDLHASCWMESFGELQRIQWTCELESLDDFAGKTEKLLQDKSYMTRLTQSAALFIPGTGRDTLAKKLF